jgi:Sec-independent protein translocase protein TatA
MKDRASAKEKEIYVWNRMPEMLIILVIILIIFGAGKLRKSGAPSVRESRTSRKHQMNLKRSTKTPGPRRSSRNRRAF